MATDALRAEKCGCLFEGKKVLRRCLQHGARNIELAELIDQELPE